MSKLLIFIPSPRDDPEFEECVAKLPHDKIWFKYHPYYKEPYNKARAFFLAHPEYSHFAICPDDLMVTPEGVEKLWKEAQTRDVIMGICNVGVTEETKDILAHTKNLPSLERDGRKYEFYRKNEVDGSIIKVKWCGTPFAIFTRRTIKKFGFNGDRAFDSNGWGFSFDVGIAHDLHKRKIPLYVDTSVYFHHKRFVFPVLNKSFYPSVWFDEYGKSRKIDQATTVNDLIDTMADFGRLEVENEQASGILLHIAHYINSFKMDGSIVPEISS